MNMTVTPPQLVICVPGPWASRTEFSEQLIRQTDGDYLFVGRLLMHVPTKQMFELEFDSRDERMPAAFAAAGPHWRETPEMARIGTHQAVIYLVGHGGADVDIAPWMHAAQALLQAGGLGIRIESTGLAHAPQAWMTMCSQIYLFSPYRAFVLVVTGTGEASSCGMHTFGMHDVRVIDDDAASASRTAGTFSWYLYTERPDVREGQTFACDAASPGYRIARGPGADYPADSLFNNPYGTWELRRL